jgi:hypothetical protein
MNTFEQQRFDSLYEQHLTNLTLQGKRPATIDAYSRAVRRITAFLTVAPTTACYAILPLSNWLRHNDRERQAI